MRSWLLLAAAVASGCVTPAEVAGPGSGAALDAACLDAGPKVVDVQAVRTGGAGALDFALSAGCALDIRFALDELVGDFVLSVRGPSGPVVAIERHGTTVAGQSVALPPRSSQEVNEGPAPAGEYAYAWRASQVVTFSLDVVAARS